MLCIQTMFPLVFSRIAAGRTPEEAVQGAAGELQPTGETCGQRLSRHPGGAGPHAAADHRRGEGGRPLVFFI